MIKTFIVFDKKSISNLLKYGPVDPENSIIIYVYQHTADPEMLEHLKLIKEMLGIRNIAINISGDLVKMINKYIELFCILLKEETCPYITLSEKTTCSVNLFLAAFLATFFLVSRKEYKVSEIYYIIHYDNHYLLFSNRWLIGLLNYLNFENIYPKKKDLLEKFINALLLVKSANNRKLASILGLSEKTTSEFSELLAQLQIIDAHMRKREKIYLLNPIVKSFVSKEKEPYFCVYYEDPPQKIVAFVNSPKTLTHVLVGFKTFGIEKIYYIGDTEKEKITKLLTITEFPIKNFRNITVEEITKYLTMEFKNLPLEKRSFEFYIEITEETKTIEILKKLLENCLKYDVNGYFYIYSNHQRITFTLHQFKNLFLTDIPREEKKILQILAKNSLKKYKELHQYYEIVAKILDKWDSRPMPYNVVDKLLQALSMIAKGKKLVVNEIYKILCRNGIYLSRSKIGNLLRDLEAKELIKINDREYEIPPLVKAFYLEQKKYERILNILNKTAKLLYSHN